MYALIADDHDVVRCGVKVVLGMAAPDLAVLECSTFGEAEELAGQHDALALAILDLKMPGMVGVGGVTAFRSRFPDIPTLVLSGNYEAADVLEALRLGAIGFVPKGISVEAMTSAFRLVLAGERFIPSDVLADGIIGLADTGHGAAERSPNQSPHLLTAREREVLSKLVDGHTNKEIAGMLRIEEITAKVHTSSIYRKLGVRNRAQAVRAALDPSRAEQL